MKITNDIVQERQHLTAVWRNGGFSASYDSFVLSSSAVLRINICAKNPPLRQAAKRYQIFIKPNSMIEEFTLWSTIQTKSKCYVIKKY